MTNITERIDDQFPRFIEDLNKASVTMLKLLIDTYPEAIFILKSHTEQAVTNAAELLNNIGVPVEHIISSVGIDSITDEMKELIIDKLTLTSLLVCNAPRC